MLSVMLQPVVRFQLLELAKYWSAIRSEPIGSIADLVVVITLFKLVRSLLIFGGFVIKAITPSSGAFGPAPPLTTVVVVVVVNVALSNSKPS